METRSYRIDGHDVHEHRLAVPLDHGVPTGPQITVFAREYVRDPDRPSLVFFQGGPGNRAPRPDVVGGWLDRALEEYRVVLLDQRGTGLSTPADRQTLAEVGDGAAQAAYLAHSRADSIVADAEALRGELCGDRPWTLLGQSFGGFIATAYLSRAPHGVAEAIITAGLPGLRASAEDVYRLTYAQTARRNAEYFARYPDDEATARAVAAHLEGEVETLPTGERLSARRFRQLGLKLGSQSGFDALHHLLEDPFTAVRGTRRLREQVLLDMTPTLSFAAHPLYAVLHEPIYAQPGLGPTAWAAQRVRDEFPEFTLDADPTAPFRFTGEHVYPWQFEEDPALVPLRDAAEALARKADFPALYDADALAASTAPVAAAIYTDDMFVPYELSIATARAIGNLRPVITNDYQHDGLRVDGRRLLDKLVAALHR